MFQNRFSRWERTSQGTCFLARLLKIKRQKLENAPNDVSEEGLINIKCMLITHLLSALFIPVSFHDTANLESCPWIKMCHTLEVLIHSICARFDLKQFLWKRISLLLLWQYLKLFHLYHSQKLFSWISCWKLSYTFSWVTSNIYCCPPRCGSNACKKRSLKNFISLSVLRDL